MTAHSGSGLITPGRSCKHCAPKGGLTRVAELGSGGTIYAPIIILRAHRRPTTHRRCSSRRGEVTVGSCVATAARAYVLVA
jgi:hypothetical protein